MEEYHKKTHQVYHDFSDCFSSLQKVLRGESQEHPLDDPDPAEETKEDEEQRLMKE